MHCCIGALGFQERENSIQKWTGQLRAEANGTQQRDLRPAPGVGDRIVVYTRRQARCHSSPSPVLRAQLSFLPVMDCSNPGPKPFTSDLNHASLHCAGSCLARTARVQLFRLARRRRVQGVHLVRGLSQV